RPSEPFVCQNKLVRLWPSRGSCQGRKRFARTNPARNDKLHRSGLLFAVQGCCIVTQTSHFRRLLDTSGWPGLGLIARWMVVLVAGTLLGAYAVVATMLPPQYEVLVTLALLTCLFMIIVRNVRRVLLAIILLDIPLQLDINYMYREEPASLGALGGLD